MDEREVNPSLVQPTSTQLEGATPQTITDFYRYFDAVPHHVWVTDEAGTAARWYNRRWYEFSGLLPAQALGNGGASIVHPEDAARLEAVSVAAFRAGRSFEVQVRLRSAAGEYRWFLTRGEPVWRAGAIEAWIGTNTDIHEQHRSERAAERARRRVEGLQRATAALSQASSSADAVASALEYGLEVVGGYAGAVLLIADDGVGLELAGQRGYDVNAAARLEGLTVHSDVQVAATVRDLEPRFMTRDETIAQLPESARYLAPRSAAVATLPLAVAGRAIGALAVSFDHDRRFSPGDRRFLMSLADVTAQALERARLFDTALRAQNRFEAALVSSRTGIWEYEPDTREIVYGGYYADLYDLPPGPGRINAAVVSAYTPPEDRDAGYSASQHAVETGDWLETEFRVQVPGQPLRWVFSRGKLAATPHGTRLLGTITDVTERRQAEEALKHSEENFRALADAMPQLAWMAHGDGHIFWYNRRWFEYTGTTLEDMAGWGWQRVHDPVHLPRVLERWQAALEDAEPFEMEFPLRAASGEWRWFLTLVNPVRDAHGNVWRWFGTNTDITTAIEAQRQLREVSELQRRFVSDAAHELRAPLTSIRGNLELVRRYPDMAAAEREEALRDAEREAGRLSRLIKDLLNIARGDASQNQLVDLEPLLLPDLLGEALRGAAHLGPHPLSGAFTTAPITVMGDRDRLKQLTLILLENAIKYSPSDTAIELRLSVDTDWAHVSVRDQGPGIAPEHLGRVFERFYRADAARTRGEDPGGTGLGLSIARLIAQAHGGEVRLESEVGVGTTATYSLPLVKRTQQV